MEGCVWMHTFLFGKTGTCFLKVRLSGDNQAPAFHLLALESKIELIIHTFVAGGVVTSVQDKLLS